MYRPTKFKLGERIRFIVKYSCARTMAVVDIKVNIGRGNRTVQTTRLKKGINRYLVSKSFRSGHGNRYLVTFVTPIIKTRQPPMLPPRLCQDNKSVKHRKGPESYSSNLLQL